jgi:hypothetical protein
VTCICSAAFPSWVVTGTTCILFIISKIRLQMSSSPRRTIPKPTTCSTPTHKQRWYTTLVGLLKEFSSITLLEVRTVAFDPSALMLAWSPVAEIVRLTLSDPKFTICKGSSNINTKNLRPPPPDTT